MSRRIGHPIDPIGQRKVLDEVDYSSPDGFLNVARSYSSDSGRWTLSTDAALADFTGRSATTKVAFSTIVQRVPPGIYATASQVPPRGNKAVAYSWVKTPNNASEVQIVSDDGGRVVFAEAADYSFSSEDPEVKLWLETDAEGLRRWIFKNAQDELLIFNESGQLVERHTPDGNVLTYTHDTNGLRITSQVSQRALAFFSSTDSNNLSYTIITLPDGGQLRYTFNLGRIQKVGFPDGTERSYLYGEDGLTGSTSPKPLWLTGVIDEAGTRLSTYKYDGSKPISTELAGGVDKYSFFYGNSFVTVTLPLQNAQATIYWENTSDGLRRMVSQSQPAGSGCAAATARQNYDGRGNVASRSDFTGQRSCYGYDTSRNLEAVRLDGLASSTSCPADLAGYSIPAPAAGSTVSVTKTSTRWHPDWRLESARAEAKKLTTWVYNGQPDPSAGNAIAHCAPSDAYVIDQMPIAVLCKKIEQATSDETGSLGFAASPVGSPRVWAYTYNRYGQMLSEDGPRTDVADTTTYTYYADTSFDANGQGHTTGDLWQVTNGLGQVTAYTLYDAAGRNLERHEANGLITQQTYTPRGWLQSQTTVSGTQRQTTTYDYDAVGQLKRVTQPDGSWVGYTYDAAHRLTDITDSLGNSIHYTLDNAGNRLKEEVKDPAGVLARTTVRVFDSLGRLQNVQVQ